MAKSRTKTKTTKTATAASILGGIGTKSATKSASTTPQINVSDEAMLEAMAAVVDAKQAKSEAENVLKMAESAIRDDATELFEGRCRADGTLHTSVKFMGKLDTDEESRPLALRFEQKRCCKKMLEDDASDPLHSAFGENFEDLFAPQRTIEIDTSKLTDEQLGLLVEKMQEAIDADTFASAVAVQKLIVPKPAFFGKRILDAEIRTMADNAAADGYAVPFASSFKL